MSPAIQKHILKKALSLAALVSLNYACADLPRQPGLVQLNQLPSYAVRREEHDLVDAHLRVIAATYQYGVPAKCPLTATYSQARRPELFERAAQNADINRDNILTKEEVYRLTPCAKKTKLATHP